jgi:hypothetical protein
MAATRARHASAERPAHSKTSPTRSSRSHSLNVIPVSSHAAVNASYPGFAPRVPCLSRRKGKTGSEAILHEPTNRPSKYPHRAAERKRPFARGAGGLRRAAPTRRQPDRERAVSRRREHDNQPGYTESRKVRWTDRGTRIRAGSRDKVCTPPPKWVHREPSNPPHAPRVPKAVSTPHHTPHKTHPSN